MPGIHGALSVRVRTEETDRIVTRCARSLRFTKVAPGGHQAIQCSLVVPRNTFNDLGPQDRIYVYDVRTGRTVVEGYTENPTPVDGPEGQQYDIAAVGGMALANDENRALIYVDKTLDNWESANETVTSASVETGSQVGGTDYAGVQMQFPNGSLAATNDEATGANYSMQRAGMTLGALHAVLQGGKDSVDWQQEFVSPAGTLAAGNLEDAAVAFDVYVGGGGWPEVIPAGTERFAFRIRRSGTPTNVADEQSYLRAAGIVVMGRRMTRDGVLVTGAAGMTTAATVTASQVVEDLMGRLLTFCDPGTAQVDATTFGIDQLAYEGGVKAATVLTDLALWEPDYLWEILETLPNGLHRFSYRAWPTVPRYEVSVKDGWRQTGSDVDLCNRVLVTWTDDAGKPQSLPVTAADAGLVDPLPGRVKDADPVNLPVGQGSTDNAARIGAQVLADKINPPKAGTVLVRRPLMDLLTGNMVMPWEIEPGYLCRVRETGDGLRITQADYDDDTVSMLLTLGTPVLTESQRLARLSRAA